MVFDPPELEGVELEFECPQCGYDEWYCDEVLPDDDATEHYICVNCEEDSAILVRNGTIILID